MKKLILLILFISIIAFPQKSVQDSIGAPWIGNFTWYRGTAAAMNLVPYTYIIRDYFDSTWIIANALNTNYRYCMPTADSRAGFMFRGWKRNENQYNERAKWLVRRYDGNLPTQYNTGGGDTNWFYHDYSEYCLPFTGNITNDDGNSEAVSNETYIQGATRLILNKTSPYAWDGAGTDGVEYNAPAPLFIDLDRNGVADYNEHGGAWVTAKHKEGVRALWLQFITAANNNARWTLVRGANNFLLGNMHNYDAYDTIWVSARNGTTWEGMWFNYPHTWNDWENGKRTYWDSVAKFPRLSNAIIYMSKDLGNATGGLPQNNVRFFEWNLCTILGLSNWWVMVANETGADNNYGGCFYDEMFTHLGKPITQHRYHGVKLANGCWVRFFQYGAVIVNPGGTSKTVQWSDIGGLAGCPPALYRFRGGQRPDWNTGGAFTSVTLTTRLVSPSDELNNNNGIGDAIILKTTDTTVIAPIIVDNEAICNAPMSDTTVISGNWIAASSSYNALNGYTPFENNWWYYYNGRVGFTPASTKRNGLMVLGSATTTATAIYRPKVGVNADYIVKHYIGHMPSGKSASINTPVTIKYATGTVSTTINQSSGNGTWITVDTLYFMKDIPIEITVTNNTNNTGRYVCADAWMLEYLPPVLPSRYQEVVPYK